MSELKPSMNFGVQSYCFRHFKDNADVAAKVREIGVDKIEVCAVHADFNDVAGWNNVIKTYRDAGVAITAIGVQTFTGDVENERKWFECAKAAGAKYISAHYTVATFDKAVPASVKLCDEFDINIAIHCHGGYSFGGQKDVLHHLMNLGGPRIGLCLDTAWCLQSGNADPVQWVEEFADRVYGVHYKDFTFGRDGMWEDVVVGTGNIDLPRLVKALDNVGFDGYAVIEYEADVENPVPALTKCVKSMRAV